MKIFALILTLVLAFLGVQSTDAAEERKLRVSIYAFDYVKGLETVYLRNVKGKPEPIRLSKANILGPFKTALNSDSKLTLCRKETGPEGEPIYPVIASVNVSESVKEPLLVLFPQSSRQRYSGLLMDRSLSEFPNGSYKLVNVSPYRIRGLVGDTKVLAPQKKVSSFKPNFSGERSLAVHFQYENKPEWKTFGRTRWVEEKDKQSLLCAYLDPRTQRMKIRGLVLRPLQ